MLVVADTSPLNYLVIIHHETLLPALYTRVVIPPAVYRELLRSETPEVVRQWLAHPPAWLTIQPPQHSLGAEAFPKLGAGERRITRTGRKGIAALPSLRTGRETFASSGSPEKEMVL